MNLNDNQQENMTWEQTLARHNQIMSDYNKQRELEETLKKNHLSQSDIKLNQDKILETIRFHFENSALIKFIITLFGVVLVLAGMLFLYHMPFIQSDTALTVAVIVWIVLSVIAATKLQELLARRQMQKRQYHLDRLNQTTIVYAVKIIRAYKAFTLNKHYSANHCRVSFVNRHGSQAYADVSYEVYQWFKNKKNDQTAYVAEAKIGDDERLYVAIPAQFFINEMNAPIIDGGNYGI